MDYYHNKLSRAASSPFIYFVFAATKILRVRFRF